MGGVHRVLHRLQPIARVGVFRARHQAIAWLDEAVVHRESRLPVGRTHIGKDDAGVLMRGVRTVTEPIFLRCC
jgi:hypothetical protein